MKNRNMMRVIFTLLLTLTVCLHATAQDRKTIQRGMSRQQVTEILGRPHTKGFNDYGEHWEYTKIRGGLFNAREALIAIDFDHNGRVAQYWESPLVPMNSTPPSGHTLPPSYGYGSSRYPYSALDLPMMIDEEPFRILYNKVKGKSFSSEQLDLIEMASLGCYYSCEQCVAMMKLFSFDDDRLSVLRLMVNRLVDMQNVSQIYRLFTFDINRNEAMQLVERVIR